MADDVDDRGLPLDPVLREKMIEDLAQVAAGQVRSMLEHKTYQEVSEWVIMPFDKFIERHYDAQRRGLASGKARREGTDDKDDPKIVKILKAYDALVKADPSKPVSVKVVAERAGCKYNHALTTIKKYRSSKNKKS